MNRSKIFLVSSDFFPSALVASRRITYWAQNLKKSMDDSTTIEVITTNSLAEKVDGIEKVHILRSNNEIRILKKISYILQLIKILRSEIVFSSVLISAGPFYWFLATPFIPKRHSVIFDLRDPFVKDSKNQMSNLKLFLKKIYQFWFIRQPDAIISINTYLYRTFSAPCKIPLIIVANGFETKNPISCNMNKKIMILGKVYDDLTKIIEKILNIDPSIEFHQFTNLKTTPETNLLPRINKVFIHDSLAPIEISDACRDFEFGLVSSYPEDFVLPVKIFDYVQANQKIIIINDKQSQQTEIKRFLQNYPNCFYIYSENFSSKEFESFLSSPIIKGSIMTFSKSYFREESTKDLGKFLQDFINKKMT